jgi:hypothetical protein
MFSEEGNRKVQEVLENTLKLPLSTTDTGIHDFIRKEFAEVAKEHKEIYDTDVRERFMGELEKVTERKYSIYFT